MVWISTLDLSYRKLSVFSGFDWIVKSVWLVACYVSFDKKDCFFMFKQALAAPKVSLFEEDEILVLEFAENLPHGVGVLQMAFSGILSDKMKGFYKR